MANSNQEIATPKDFFNAIENFLGIKFTYDMAASEENKKCSLYYTEADNSLSFEWPKDSWCWLNPPFRKLSKFIPKCSEEMKAGAKIVSIWPLSGDLNQLPAWKEANVYVVHGRVWPEVRGLMICVWDKDRPNNGVHGLRWDKESLVEIW